MTDPADHIIGLYDENAEGWIEDRGEALGGLGKSIDELDALDRFTAALPPGGTVLDIGCGSGWPWGAALLERGFHVTGVDASPRLVAHAARTLPRGEWIVGDMRDLSLGRAFDGLLLWYSLFHLRPADQAAALTRALGHAHASSVVMMTVSEEVGIKVGSWRGRPLYHASLGGPGYAAQLASAGFARLPGPASPAAGSAAWLFRARGFGRAVRPNRVRRLDHGAPPG